jgi:hypothetical protein
MSLISASSQYNQRHRPYSSVLRIHLFDGKTGGHRFDNCVDRRDSEHLAGLIGRLIPFGNSVDRTARGSQQVCRSWLPDNKPAEPTVRI